MIEPIPERELDYTNPVEALKGFAEILTDHENKLNQLVEEINELQQDYLEHLADFHNIRFSKED